MYEYLKRFVLTNLLTLYYTGVALFYCAITYLKNPFSNPWAVKLKLEPPPQLTDPKYGVHKYIKVNNTKLHYVESGDSSKPLMVFLHGFPEFWYSWRYQILEFQKDYWCVAVDMRGYGDSERPEGVEHYKMELLVEDVRDLIRQLGREKFMLVAHDWGGLISCEYRNKYPETLSGLVLLASASRTAWFQEVWTSSHQRQQSWYVFLYRMPKVPELLFSINDLQVYDQVMVFPGKATNKEDIECYKYWFRKPFALTPPINYYRANFGVDWPEIVEHKENVPMLVGLAEKDNYLTPGLLDTMKKEYSCIETAIVKDTAHFLQQEDPDKVNNLIREFLSKHNI